MPRLSPVEAVARAYHRIIHPYGHLWDPTPGCGCHEVAAGVVEGLQESGHLIVETTVPKPETTVPEYHKGTACHCPSKWARCWPHAGTEAACQAHAHDVVVTITSDQ